jgi:tRNA 2-thiouridine synthesizing protein A
VAARRNPVKKSARGTITEKIQLETLESGEVNMRVELLDTVGLKCPHPVIKIAVKAPDMEPGDILEILGDCPTFERDVLTWCKRLEKDVLSVEYEGGDKKRIQIQF